MWRPKQPPRAQPPQACDPATDRATSPDPASSLVPASWLQVAHMRLVSIKMREIPGTLGVVGSPPLSLGGGVIRLHRRVPATVGVRSHAGRAKTVFLVSEWGDWVPFFLHVCIEQVFIGDFERASEHIWPNWLSSFLFPVSGFDFGFWD